MFKKSFIFSATSKIQSAHRVALPVLALTVLGACSGVDSRAEGTGQGLSLALSVPEESEAPVGEAPSESGGLAFSDGTSTLEFTSAELVVRELRLKRAQDSACDGASGSLDDSSGTSSSSGLTSADDGSSSGSEGADDADDAAEAEAGDDNGVDDPATHDVGDDHGGQGEIEDELEDADEVPACQTVAVGPMLLSLPLDGGMSTEIQTTVPADTYRAIEIRIHKPENDGTQNEFVEANPTFARVSIRVDGYYNGAAFSYESAVNAKQLVPLAEPLVVTDQPVSVTLSVDLATWFADGQGMFVDPATAMKGGMNEKLVEDNIKASIEGFEDRNQDGSPDQDNSGSSSAP
ncbi:MAG: hypothetical protein HY903_03795 [Deltaproteobacteria bacterium]|nr:hypothetical protein [Deltaproteobacteria bacterium]